MQRIILHIDFDSFFASVEQQHDPSLRHIPMGVTAHNGRTAIIAASREAKRMGVKNVMRTYDALRICPKMKFVTANFDRYWEVSKKFIKICNDFSENIEVFSIDELFMDVTLTVKLFRNVENLIFKLKKRISDEMGEYITVSVGISTNKLLAKLASGLKKPNGLFEISQNNLISVYGVCKLTDICGIGSRIERRLNMMGIYTLLQLRKARIESLVAEFGNVEGNFLYNVGKGDDVSPVKSYAHVPDVKSVSRNYCLARNEYDNRVVLQNIYELSEEVCIKLRKMNKKARHFGVYLRGTNNIYGHLLLPRYTNMANDMFRSCLICINKNKDLFETGYIRQISVFASYLKDSNTITESLFLSDRKREKVTKVIDKLNARYGNHTIRNGYVLYADKLTTKPNGFMADRYERMLLGDMYPR